MSSKFIKGFEKEAMDIGAISSLGAGLIGGHSAGKSMARTTAGDLSRKGFKTRNEETAHNVSKITAPLGALAGVALALKHHPKLVHKLEKHISSHPDMRQLYHYAVPALGGTAGGMAAGAATGGLTALRGSLSGKKKEHEKTAGPIGSAVKAVGKKALSVAGGPLSAAMTGLGAMSDYSNLSAKMQAARSGNL